jgi:hypothetical protein
MFLVGFEKTSGLFLGVGFLIVYFALISSVISHAGLWPSYSLLGISLPIKDFHRTY